VLHTQMIMAHTAAAKRLRKSEHRMSMRNLDGHVHPVHSTSGSRCLVLYRLGHTVALDHY
jgi:hypothetical protein